MSWVRVDDHFDEHPKFQKAGPLAAALWLAGLAYCNRNLTDGKIPRAKAASLWSWTFWDQPDGDGRCREVTTSVTSGYWGDEVSSGYVIQRLIDSGLWEDRGDFYLVHDYLKYQPSRVTVLEERGRNREKQQRHRERNRVTNQPVTTPPNPNTNSKPTALRRSADSESLGGVQETSESTPLLNGSAVEREWRAAFDEHFWPVAPRKVGKAAAMRAWVRLGKGLSFEDREFLIGRIMRRLEQLMAGEWKTRQPEHVPYPATFLNGESFDEEATHATA